MGVVAWQMSHTTTSLSLGMVRIEPHSPQKCTLRACVWKTRFQLCCTLIVPVLGRLCTREREEEKKKTTHDTALLQSLTQQQRKRKRGNQ